jgi:signal transduction histidine kinase
VSFEGGPELLAGRTLAERDYLKSVARKSLASVCIAYLVLGAAAGALIAKYANRRLGAINAAADKVLNGDLSVRAKLSGAGDEYDQLARNFNSMLDRIQRLIETVRGVTENIAHDLRTPLNRLRGKLELALMSQRTPEEYQAVLHRAICDTEGIVETFNGMLKIGRITSGILDLPQKRVDLAEVATELIDLYQVFAQENDVALEVQLPAGAPAVYILGDGHLISQATANLLDNAIKYSPPGGRVVIRVTSSAEGVSFTVSDEGPGIPDDKIAAMRERFVRLERFPKSGTRFSDKNRSSPKNRADSPDSSESGSALEPAPAKPGYGLGLSFVFAVTELHKAQLTLTNGNPGFRAALTFRPPPNAAA